MIDWRRFGEEIAKAEDGILVHGDAVERARAGFLEQAALPAARGDRAIGRRRTALAFAFAAAAALALASAALLLREQGGTDGKALSATVDGARRALSPGEWIASPPASGRRIAFSDGSVIGLSPGSGARVVTLSGDGARFSLEHGEADVEVRGRPGARWQVDVGPYTVAVKGTRFTVAWSPGAQRFTLSLEEGSVFVRGPLLGEGRRIEVSETLRAFVAEGRLEIAAGEAAAIDDGPAAAKEPPAPLEGGPAGAGAERASSTGSGRGAAPTESRDPEPPGWRSLALAGEHGAALAAARARGIRAVIAESPASDLELLGDAARLGRDFETANRCYRAIREKLPGGADAANAAFALGKLDFDHRHLYSEAARWMEVYLAESGPDAVLAREALGRLIEAAHRAGDDRRARNAAERYLASYPNGPHAGIAAGVLRSPGQGAAQPGP